jgi:hypothetical protein
MSAMEASLKAALTSRVYDADDFAATQELYHSNGWTDGLPVVPPTQSAVEACLDWGLMRPDQLIGIEPVREQPIIAEKLAINAVMAGCLPMHFPIVATAWQAMMKDEFLLHGVTSSTGGCAILVIINGPIRLEIGANATFNALANSDRATAVIGRALRLALINLLDVRPGGIDRSTLGHPGKFSYCLAEDKEGTAWQPLSAVRGVPEGASAVTVMAAMAPRQIMNEWTTDPKEILETFAAEMRANQRHYSIYGGNYAIVVPKQCASISSAPAGRSGTSPIFSMSVRASAARNGPMSERARWCATEASASTPRWDRRTIFWSWPQAAPPAASAPSFHPGWAARPKR